MLIYYAFHKFICKEVKQKGNARWIVKWRLLLTVYLIMRLYIQSLLRKSFITASSKENSILYSLITIIIILLLSLVWLKVIILLGITYTQRICLY